MADLTTLPDTKTAALFPGVPLIESPIFDSEDLAGFSDQEKTLARQLNTDGFGVIDFPDPDIDVEFCPRCLFLRCCGCFQACVCFQ